MRKLLTTGLSIIVLCLSYSTAFADDDEDTGNKLPIGAEENLDKIVKGNIAAAAIEKSLNDNEGERWEWLEILTNADLVATINIIIGTVAILWLIILGIMFIIDRGDSEKLTQYKQRFGWTILGLFVVALAEFAAFNIFNPADTNLDLIGGEKAIENLIVKVEQVKLFFEIFVVGVMIIVGGMSGFNFIIRAETDDAIEQEKRFIQNFLFGFALILLAEVIVRIFTNKTMQDLSPDFDPEQSSAIIISETVGLINMILTYVAGAATLMMILASLYYISSFGNEDQMNRAKRIVISSVVAIIIAFSSYTLVAFLAI